MLMGCCAAVGDVLLGVLMMGVGFGAKSGIVRAAGGAGDVSVGGDTAAAAAAASAGCGARVSA